MAQNDMAQFWNERQSKAPDNKALALVFFDLARSKAKKAERGGDEGVWYSLATALHAWCADNGE
jgi:hypothetical protein